MSLIAADMLRALSPLRVDMLRVLSPLRVDPTNFGSPRQDLLMNITVDNGGPIISELQLSVSEFFTQVLLELTNR